MRCSTSWILAELDTYRDRVNAVTVDDIQHVAMEYYKPDQMSIVMVGNASAFVDQLSALGFGEYELIPLAQLDLLSPTLGGTGVPHVTPVPEDDRATTPANTPATAPANTPANDTARQAGLVVVQRAIAAKGGATRLASVETVKIRATSTLATPQGPVTAATVTYIEYPGSIPGGGEPAGRRDRARVRRWRRLVFRPGGCPRCASRDARRFRCVR